MRDTQRVACEFLLMTALQSLIGVKVVESIIAFTLDVLLLCKHLTAGELVLLGLSDAAGPHCLHHLLLLSQRKHALYVVGTQVGLHGLWATCGWELRQMLLGIHGSLGQWV